MEFAADVVNGGRGRGFPDPPSPPPQHGDDSMLMIRDALLSQLQKDRLRQEIIVAELAKIERAMALCSAAADAECAKPAPLDFDETYSVTPPKKKPPSTKWSCAICHVEATSAGNLLQHFSGQKHGANVLALKAKARAEKSRKAMQCADQKPRPPWTCRFCQADCTGKSDLENHLNGRRHRANIQALLEQCKSMARDSPPNVKPQDGHTPPDSVSTCGICQVKWSCQSVMESHVRGKKHQANFQALQLEAKRLGIIRLKTASK